MADHVDKRIRDAAAQRLTGLPTTGARVFPSRAYPLQDDELPALRIFVDDAEVTVVSIGFPALQERDIELVVEHCGKAAANYDDEADASKNEVEKALAADPTLGGVLKSLALNRIETQREHDGEQVRIVTVMTFTCKAFTDSNAPDVPL